MEKHFSIEESLRFGWRKTRDHSALIFKALLTLFAVEIAYQVVIKVLGNTLEGGVASVILVIALIVVGVGFTRIMLRIAEGHAVVYVDIVPPVRVILRYLVAGIFVGVLTAVGFILLIIPGVYFMLRYSMVRFAILEEPKTEGFLKSVTESLRKSAALTHGVKWHLLGFLVVVILVNIVGMLLFLVGLLITVPVTTIAYAHVYQKLKSRTHGVEGAK